MKTMKSICILCTLLLAVPMVNSVNAQHCRRRRPTPRTMYRNAVVALSRHNREQGVWLMNAAARNGHPEAMLVKGLFFSDDTRLRTYWLRNAAQSGSGFAMAALGSYYEKKGYHGTARRWYRQALHRGIASYDLTRFFEDVFNENASVVYRRAYREMYDYLADYYE